MVFLEIIKGKSCLYFPRTSDLKDLNKVEVLAILEALRTYLYSFHNSLTAENDSSDAMNPRKGWWKLQFQFNEVESLSSVLQAIISARQ